MIDSGRTFKIMMADGKVYEVPHRDFIPLPPRGTNATIYDDEERFSILPFRTTEEHASSEG